MPDQWPPGCATACVERATSKAAAQLTWQLLCTESQAASARPAVTVASEMGSCSDPIYLRDLPGTHRRRMLCFSTLRVAV
jgi:hypothetical protein